MVFFLYLYLKFLFLFMFFNFFCSLVIFLVWWIIVFVWIFFNLLLFLFNFVYKIFFSCCIFKLVIDEIKICGILFGNVGFNMVISFLFNMLFLVMVSICCLFNIFGLKVVNLFSRILYFLWILFVLFGIIKSNKELCFIWCRKWSFSFFFLLVFLIILGIFVMIKDFFLW